MAEALQRAVVRGALLSGPGGCMGSGCWMDPRRGRALLQSRGDLGQHGAGSGSPGSSQPAGFALPWLLPLAPVPTPPPPVRCWAPLQGRGRRCLGAATAAAAAAGARATINCAERPGVLARVTIDCAELPRCAVWAGNGAGPGQEGRGLDGGGAALQGRGRDCSGDGDWSHGSNGAGPGR